MNGQSGWSKNKKQKILQNKKVLEQLGELSSEAVNVAVNETQRIGSDALNQLFGLKTEEKHSGDINPGSTLELKDIISQKEDENLKLKETIKEERLIFSEIQSETQKKLDSLRMRLKVLMNEAVKLTQSAANLGKEAQIAAITMPEKPGEYHINFIQNLIEYLVTFRKKVDSAVNWLAESSKRAQKKNYWSMYKKKGASFLLSGESYSSRSAG